MYAQTLNADTLAKYRVSKILTYDHKPTIDSLHNNDTLLFFKLPINIFINNINIRTINEKGLEIEKIVNKEGDIYQFPYHMLKDTSRYIYNSAGKLISSINTQISNYMVSWETSWQSHKQTTSLYRYKSAFFIVLSANKKISFCYSKNNKVVMKTYLNGEHINTSKCLTARNNTISRNKYWELKSSFNSTTSKNIQRKYWVKTIIRTNTQFNSNRDKIKETISTKYCSANILKKSFQYSKVITYRYVYKGSFITECTYSGISYSIAYEQNKRATHVIDFKIGDAYQETKFYEYITNP